MPGNLWCHYLLLLISIYFRDREWERERERLLMSDGKESHSVYSSAPLSPMRSEEFDYQQSNITLLKVLWGLRLQYIIYDYLWWFIYGAVSKPLPFNQAQLKLVTHERDNLKKDVKRISQVKFMRKTEVTVNNWLAFKERDGAYRHLSLSASPQSSLETPASHHRTNSDTAPTVAKSGEPVFWGICKE